MKSKRLLTKIMVLTLTAVMTASVFSGCSKDKEDSKTNGENTVSSSGKVSDKPIKFTMLYADNSAYPYKADWPTLQKMKELTNVELEAQVVPDSDFATKRQIMLSSGTFPDIVSKTNAGSVKDFVTSGIILPISDHLDKLPNFKKFIDKNDYKTEIDNMTEADGKFYGLPVNAYTKKVQPQLWVVRKDVFEKNNIKIPTTYDELYTAAKALKQKYPDTYPIINRFGTGNILSVIAPSFGTSAGWGLGNGGFVYNKNQNKWIFAPTSDEYKAMLQFCNKMVTEGLMDKEFATLDSNVYTQRVQQGKAFILADWVDTLSGYNSEGKKVDPNFNIEPVMPFKGPSGIGRLRAIGYAEQGWVLPASVKEKPYFNTLMRFVDWMYTDEAADLFTWGVEGKSYKNVNGKKDYVDDIKSGKVYAPKEYGVYNNNLTVIKPFEWFMAMQTPAAAKVYEEMDKNKAIPDPDPTLRLSADQREEEKLTRPGLEDYFNQMTEKFIYGKESFDNWDKFVQECNKKGVDKLSKLYNSVWEKQKK